MKKVLLPLFVLLFFVSIANAQYQPGKDTFGALLGVGNGSLPGSGGIPIALEYNFTNIIDNKIQLGAFAAFASTKDDFNWGWGDGYYRYMNIILAAQANYHFLPGKEFDPYAGISLGFNIASASWTWNKQNSGYSEPSASSSGIFWNIQGGFNYWFSKKWAFQFRLGYFPYVGVGVTAAL